VQESVALITKTLANIRALLRIKPRYGSLPSLEMMMEKLKGEMGVHLKKIYDLCDKLFKFFSWSIAIGIACILWESTRSIIFAVVMGAMVIALTVYLIVISFYPLYYITTRINKFGVNTKVAYATFLIALSICAVEVPRVFVVAVEKLIRVQACSTYHKESPNIPPKCREFVRL